jgi:hypothetical protein
MLEQNVLPNTGETQPLIDLRNVVKTYNSLAGSVTARIDFLIAESSWSLLESGSGKTPGTDGLDRLPP